MYELLREGFKKKSDPTQASLLIENIINKLGLSSLSSHATLDISEQPHIYMAPVDINSPFVIIPATPPSIHQLTGPSS